MTNLPASPLRALTGLGALICMTVGAGILWGFGAALFALGLFMAIDCSFDEAIERITKTTRGKRPDPVGTPQAGEQS